MYLGINMIPVIKVNALLCMALTSPVIDNQPSCNLVCEKSTLSLFKYGERKVYSCADARTGIDVITLLKKNVCNNLR